MKDRAIVLSTFGVPASVPVTCAYAEEKFLKRFPDEDFFMAFPSREQGVENRHEGMSCDSTWHVLEKLKKEGYKKIVFQSLHIVPGMEFEKETKEVEKSHLCVSVGMPLLSSEIDCYRALDAMSDRIPDPEDCITVFVGSGTTHSGAGTMYMQFAGCVKAKYNKNVHVCLTDGVLFWESALGEIKRSEIKKIKFIPLMFVAGEQMKNDLFGSHNNAWKSQLNGYEINGSEKGLGFNEKILEIYFDHLQNAMDRL